MGMNSGLAIFGIIGVIVLVLFAVVKVHEGYENDIRTWASNHNYTITSMDQKMMDLGPYYYVPKGGCIYRVEIIDSNSASAVFYFRFGGWGGPDICVWH